MEQHKNYRVDWFTPISDCRDVEFAKLVTDADLDLICVFWAYRKTEKPFFISFKWQEWEQYKCTNLLQLTSCDYNVNHPSAYKSRYTCTVGDSTWAHLIQNEVTVPRALTHFVVFSVTTGVEVLSPEHPIVECISEKDARHLGLESQTRIKTLFVERAADTSE